MRQFEDRDFTPHNTVEPQNQDEKDALSEFAATLLPNDELTVHTRKMSRSLTVTERFRSPYENGIESPSVLKTSLGGEDACILLEGYGTEYAIVSNNTTSRPPHIYWPSNSLHGSRIVGISIEERESEIVSEQNAADMYYEVSKYDGK